MKNNIKQSGLANSAKIDIYTNKKLDWLNLLVTVFGSGIILAILLVSIHKIFGLDLREYLPQFN